MLILVGLLGLVIGSFINAVVWRLHEKSIVDSRQSIGKRIAARVAAAKSPKTANHDIDDVSQLSTIDYGLSITRGRSMCPDCRHQLGVWDLVPVLSWVMLGGKCRYCHKRISVQYPLVELLTAVLFALSGSLFIDHYSLFNGVNLIFWLYFLVVLVILALYDLRWYILPDVVLLPAIVVAAVRLPVLLLLRQPVGGVADYVLAAVAVGGAFYALAAVSKGRWMGGGDIKLVFLMGLILGWGKMAVALLLAFNSGAIVGILLIALKLKHRRDHIPFGPFLVGGTIVAMLYGQQIIDWYLRMMGI